MKKLFVCAAALTLLACVPTSAKDNDHRGDAQDNGTSTATQSSSDHRGDNKANDAKGGNRAIIRQNSSSGQAVPAPTTRSRFLPASGDIRSGARNNAGLSNTNNHQPDVNSRRGNSGWANTNNRQPVVNSRQGNMGWTGNQSRDSLRHNMQASRRYHGGNYFQPAGYQYRHWTYGERLPRQYYERNYWITDFVTFSLFAPPSDLVWVRVGNDALLIDRYTGDIVQVQYDFFY